MARPRRIETSAPCARSIAGHRRRDMVFAVVGLAALMLGVATFVALFIDMAVDGWSRLDWRVPHQLPVAPRRAGRHPRAPGSAPAGDAGHRAAAVPLGIAAAIYLEEYARARMAHRRSSRSTSPTSPACRRSSTACWRWAVRATVRLRPEHPDRGPDAGAADPADRDRGHPRGDPRDARHDPRGGVCAGRHAVADGAPPRAAVFDAAASSPA